MTVCRDNERRIREVWSKPPTTKRDELTMAEEKEREALEDANTEKQRARGDRKGVAGFIVPDDVVEYNEDASEESIDESEVMDSENDDREDSEDDNREEKKNDDE